MLQISFNLAKTTMMSSRDRQFFNAAIFFFLSLASSLSFMSITLVGLELWQLLLIRDLTRDTKTEYTVWVLPNVWRLKRVGDANIDMNVSDEKLLNAAKCQDYSFYHFWLIKGKQTGVVGRNIPTQIGVKHRIKVEPNF